MPEEDLTHLSEEENEAVFKILDRTPQIDRAEAIGRVIGRARARKVLQAEAAATQKDSASSRPTKPYRAKFQDSTDESVRAFREGTEAHTEISDEEMETGRESYEFMKRVVDSVGGFNLEQYLQEHPEETEEARRLGLLE